MRFAACGCRQHPAPEPASLPHVAPAFCPDCLAVGAIVVLESGAYCRECPFDILAEDMPGWHAEALRRDQSGAVWESGARQAQRDDVERAMRDA